MTVIFMIHFDAGSIDPSSITPMYKQVAGIISEGIRTGELKVGEKLPSEFELMKDFNVSRVTIRGAISELVTDGFWCAARERAPLWRRRKSSSPPMIPPD